MGKDMKKKTDIFSSFCTGQALIEQQKQDRYESTPGFVFDSLLQECPFMTLADIDEESRSFVYALHSPEVIWGLARFDMAVLPPLGQLAAQSHTRHLWQISTREDMRGWGLFSTAMDKIVEVAEEAGIFLHGISSPFILKWPDIQTEEDFLWFLKNERKFFAEQKTWQETKSKSRKLLKKYQEFGFCKFRYPSGNGFKRRWMRDHAGFGYMSSSCDEEVRQTLERYLTC